MPLRLLTAPFRNITSHFSSNLMAINPAAAATTLKFEWSLSLSLYSVVKNCAVGVNLGTTNDSY